MPHGCTNIFRSGNIAPLCRPEVIQKIRRRENLNPDIFSDVDNRFIARNDGLGIQRNGAFNEFVVVRVFLHDMQVRRFRGKHDMKSVSEKREQFIQLFVGLQPRASKNRHILRYDRLGKT